MSGLRPPGGYAIARVDGRVERVNQLTDALAATHARVPARDVDELQCEIAHLERLRLQLEEALQSRGTIERAKGILMVLRRCTADEAFALLRKQSQHENVSCG